MDYRYKLITVFIQNEQYMQPWVSVRMHSNVQKKSTSTKKEMERPLLTEGHTSLD